MNKIATTIEQSKKLAEILPLKSADMHYWKMDWKTYHLSVGHSKELQKGFEAKNIEYLPAWSLAALMDVLPEINGIPLTLEKVKAKDGYEGYYYHIEYENIILIPYSKNPVDACYEMILKLHELNLL